MTATTARLRQTAVLIVDCPIPDGMTIEEYRRARAGAQDGPRRRRRRRPLRRSR